jgi:hypothetical protein
VSSISEAQPAIAPFVLSACRHEFRCILVNCECQRSPETPFDDFPHRSRPPVPARQIVSGSSRDDPFQSNQCRRRTVARLANVVGARSGLGEPGTSQSMQQNLRPPVFTSTKCMGLWHFGQEGGGGFLGMWTLTLDQAGAQHSQSPGTAEDGGGVMIYCAPFVLTKASQFRTAKQGRGPDLAW